MILILSEETDVSTSDVIEWLTSFGAQCIRINTEDELKINLISLNETENVVLNSNNGDEIDLSKINSFWYRRGVINLSNFKHNIPINPELQDHLYKEKYYLLNFVYFLLEKKHSLGKFNNAVVSKLKSLYYAEKCNLKIPKTNVFYTKTQIEELRKSNNKLITKCIQDMPQIVIKDKGWFLYTEEIDDLNLAEINENFSPSIVQEKINKKYELRVFYLNGKCYSMAIFSQLDKQTETDFRKYNLENPNRNVPYKLPQNVENKIRKLMNLLDLNTGSIDIIVTKNNEYVFLEVNPVGQFGMVSQPCNYYLEKKIAEYLKKY